MHAIPFRSRTVNSTSQNVQQQKCKLMGFNICNLHSADIFVKLYDKASAASTDTPKYTIQVKANNPALLRGEDMPFYFDTALSVRAVTGNADNDTTAPATLPIIEMDTSIREIDEPNQG